MSNCSSLLHIAFICDVHVQMPADGGFHYFQDVFHIVFVVLTCVKCDVRSDIVRLLGVCYI